MLTIDEVKTNISVDPKNKVIDFYNVLIPVFNTYESILKTEDYGLKDFNDF